MKISERAPKVQHMHVSNVRNKSSRHKYVYSVYMHVLMHVHASQAHATNNQQTREVSDKHLQDHFWSNPHMSVVSCRRWKCRSEPLTIHLNGRCSVLFTHKARSDDKAPLCEYDHLKQQPCTTSQSKQPVAGQS